MFDTVSNTKNVKIMSIGLHLWFISTSKTFISLAFFQIAMKNPSASVIWNSHYSWSIFSWLFAVNGFTESVSDIIWSCLVSSFHDNLFKSTQLIVFEVIVKNEKCIDLQIEMIELHIETWMLQYHMWMWQIETEMRHFHLKIVTI